MLLDPRYFSGFMIPTKTENYLCRSELTCVRSIPLFYQTE